ncbi:MAG TPA: DUF4390 domain-containing protein [Ramlibacter sp.]|nr:DUF4390 domain-containing protein [Ramlibacter sp.]
MAFFILAFALAGAARSEPTGVSSMRVERAGDGLVLSAQLSFDLPHAVDETLQKGIPLFFVTDAVVLRDRWYWYDKEVAAATRHLRLSFQPLTRRWRLVVSNTQIGPSTVGLSQSFDTKEEAIAAVQHISGWRIAESGEVEPDRRYSVSLRFRLDVSQLPRPFQIGVVGQSEWNIGAERTLRLSPELLR